MWRQMRIGQRKESLRRRCFFYPGREYHWVLNCYFLCRHPLPCHLSSNPSVDPYFESMSPDCFLHSVSGLSKDLLVVVSNSGKSYLTRPCLCRPESLSARSSSATVARCLSSLGYPLLCRHRLGDLRADSGYPNCSAYEPPRKRYLFPVRLCVHCPLRLESQP